MTRILFSQARETLKAGGLIFIQLFSFPPTEIRIEHFGAVIAEIISGENDNKPGENVPETLTEPEMVYMKMKILPAITDETILGTHKEEDDRVDGRVGHGQPEGSEEEMLGVRL